MSINDSVQGDSRTPCLGFFTGLGFDYLSLVSAIDQLSTIKEGAKIGFLALLSSINVPPLAIAIVC